MSSQRYTPKGTLYGIGVGPGDPELLTIRAYRIITTAPIIFFPAGRGGHPGFAQQIVAQFLDMSRQQLIPLPFALNHHEDELQQAWEAAAHHVTAALATGSDAVFLSEGDPLTYSTFTHLMRTLQALNADLKINVIPGITSFAAATAAARFPLVDGDQRVAILPALYGPRLAEILNQFDTIVLLKVSPVFDQVLDQLEALGLADQALYARRIGRPEQELYFGLSALRGKVNDYFSLVIIYTQRGMRHA